MDKKEFYLQLSEKLSALGVDDKYISRHISQFDGYFSGKSDKEISAEISKLGDLDRVALRIKKMTDKIAEEENNYINDQNEEIPEIRDNEDNYSDHSDVADNVVTTNENVSGDSVKSEQNADNNIADPIATESGSETNSKLDRSDFGQNDIEISTDNHHDSASDKDIDYMSVDAENFDELNNENSEISKYVPDEETLKRNKIKFWAIFCVSLPLIIIILMAVIAGFCTAFFIIAMLIVLSVMALIGVVAGGTLISVFGIIFGIVKSLSVLPVGLYECGIGIVVGGITMLSGILIYNFAVRLMPFTAKHLLKFTNTVKKKFAELFLYVKKECIGS